MLYPTVPRIGTSLLGGFFRPITTCGCLPSLILSCRSSGTLSGLIFSWKLIGVVLALIAVGLLGSYCAHGGFVRTLSSRQYIFNCRAYFQHGPTINKRRLSSACLLHWQDLQLGADRTLDIRSIRRLKCLAWLTDLVLESPLCLRGMETTSMHALNTSRACKSLWQGVNMKP